MKSVNARWIVFPKKILLRNVFAIRKESDPIQVKQIEMVRISQKFYDLGLIIWIILD